MNYLVVNKQTDKIWTTKGHKKELDIDKKKKRQTDEEISPESHNFYETSKENCC
jgi:hypothetical protein